MFGWLPVSPEGAARGPVPPGCSTPGCALCAPWHGEVQMAARRAHTYGSHGWITRGQLTRTAHTNISRGHLARTAHTDSGWHPHRPRHGPRWREPARLHLLRSTGPAPAPAPGPLMDEGFAPAAPQLQAGQDRQQQCAGHTTKAPQGPQAKPLWPCGPTDLQLTPPCNKAACLPGAEAALLLVRGPADGTPWHGAWHSTARCSQLPGARGAGWVPWGAGWASWGAPRAHSWVCSPGQSQARRGMHGLLGGGEA